MGQYKILSMWVGLTTHCHHRKPVSSVRTSLRVAVWLEARFVKYEENRHPFRISQVLQTSTHILVPFSVCQERESLQAAIEHVGFAAIAEYVGPTSWGSCRYIKRIKLAGDVQHRVCFSCLWRQSEGTSIFCKIFLERTSHSSIW